MSRKAWLNPRMKKLVKPHTILTRSGKVAVTEPYLHDYPHALEKPKEGREKKGEEEKNLKPKKESQEKEIEQAKSELACSIGA